MLSYQGIAENKGARALLLDISSLRKKGQPVEKGHNLR